MHSTPIAMKLGGARESTRERDKEAMVEQGAGVVEREMERERERGRGRDTY